MGLSTGRPLLHNLRELVVMKITSGITGFMYLLVCGLTSLR